MIHRKKELYVLQGNWKKRQDTDLRIWNGCLLSVQPLHSATKVFVARDLIPSKQHLDEDEFVDVKAYELEELKQMIFEGKIQDSKTMAAILAYESKYIRK